jgi:cytochrome c oxidase subunit 3
MNSDQKIKQAHRTLLTIGMFSVIMLFAGLTSAYIVSKGSLGTQWDSIILPNMFYISTLMICVSSLFGYISIKYVSCDNFKMLTKSLLSTILFGGLFFVFQVFGWYALINDGKFLTGNNVASSYIYVLTLTHIVHFVGGLIPLIIVFIRSINNKYNSANFHGLKLVIRFWHFLAILWLYLFLFLMFIN